MAYEFLTNRLRCIADEQLSWSNTRRTLYQAADALENQDKLIRAQQDIIEKLKKRSEVSDKRTPTKISKY